MYTLEVKVKSVKGECAAGYKVGDMFTVTDPVVVPRENCPLCIYALSTLFPYLTAAYRETDTGDWIHQVTEIQCPDSKNTVVFELKRR
ncbi:MAG: TIGR04076 family protein [Bacillota bacterium]